MDKQRPTNLSVAVIRLWGVRLYQFVTQPTWIVIVALLLGSWARTWRLDELGIFFGDAARDLTVAYTALSEHRLPLLGIPSSVPEFKQGPISIWIQMLVMSVAGPNWFAVALTFAFINIMAGVGLYQVASTELSPQATALAVLLLMVSPLGIAHGRMAYHITPIPLMVALYLAGLLFVWKSFQNQRLRSWHWVIAWVSWWGLFQFELAMLPLALLLGYVLFAMVHAIQRNTHRKIRETTQIIKTFIFGAFWGTVVGLAPQLIYDFEHHGEHLGGFLIWVVRRSASTLNITSTTQINAQHLIIAMQHLWQFWNRLLGFDQPVISILWLLGIGLVTYQLFRQYRAKSEFSVNLGLLATVGWWLLTLGFTIHGTPSEAYFPPFLTLVPIILGWGYDQTPVQLKPTMALIVVWVVLNSIAGIFQYNFFVSTNKAWQYGPSVAEQREIVTTAALATKNQYVLTTSSPGKVFASYFANLRWWGQRLGLPESPNSAANEVWIEPLSSPLLQYPGAKLIRLQSTAVIQLPLGFEIPEEEE